ncbi:hypothetical protein SAMN05421846_11822 [Chryseobacterium taeanense]|uniref:Uncharacterized protein n=2 Tax=Chryseobacterium taeanense TaxID=311334 RepID=A0A1G8PAL5_9FLAO|nr:hypothetical protein SAMN05421846_11822 [Chryseobacterium taeanense]
MFGMYMKFNIISVVCLLFFGAANAQKTKIINDTLSYARKFETNKEKYIGKPFSLLLKDMALMQPTKAKSDIREDSDNPLPGTIFIFSDKDINSEKEVTMAIKWKADAAPTTPLEFFEQEHNYRFTANEKNFLEKKIVKDIAVYRR